MLDDGPSSGSPFSILLTARETGWGGKELAEKITRRLHRQSQFEVVSQGKLQRYLAMNA